jgi:hypothetical protein
MNAAAAWREMVRGAANFAIAERLAKSDPGNAGWQHKLSVSYANLADAFKKSSKTGKALDALLEGRAIMSRLTAMSPENADWKKELTWFEREIGRLSSRDHGSPIERPLAKPDDVP